MSQQKALFLESKQGEWVVRTKAIQKPQAGELLVKIHATALNPVDWKIQKYGLPYVDGYPAVLGTDSSGTVEEVGEGVEVFVKGDRVVHQGYFTADKATFQQYTIVPAEICAKLPSNTKISFDQAASIPLGLATAAVGFYNKKDEGGAGLSPSWEAGGRDKYQGKPIVVFGGSSSVGQYVIQLAKLSGFSPIIATASTHNSELLKSLGATHVVDRKSDVPAEVAKIVSKPVEIVFDAISLEDTQKAGWEILAPTGQLLLTLPAQVDRNKYPEKSIVNMFGNVHTQRALGKSLYSKLTSLLDDGLIVPNRVEVLPNGLHGIVEGLKRMENDAVSGVKLIARPQETA